MIGYQVQDQHLLPESSPSRIPWVGGSGGQMSKRIPGSVNGFAEKTLSRPVSFGLQTGSHFC
jgi:hypothetical protein